MISQRVPHPWVSGPKWIPGPKWILLRPNLHKMLAQHLLLTPQMNTPNDPPTTTTPTEQRETTLRQRRVVRGEQKHDITCCEALAMTA